MKIFAIIILSIASLSIGKAQNKDKMPVGFHTHDGFYLSMGIGPLFGNISDNVINAYKLNISGTGAQFDFKIGGAISENLILHATLIGNALTGPTIKIEDNPGQKAPDNLSVGEAMIGAGLTYYIMPSNIFLSGSAGLGNFSITDKSTNTNVSTQRGFSMQCKIGKEWWVSKNWGLGISLTYGKTNLTNKPGGGTEEKLDSNRFGVLFNATFN